MTQEEFKPVVGETCETSFDFGVDPDYKDAGFNVIKVMYVHRDVVVGEDSKGKAWGYITSIYKFRPEVHLESAK